MPCSPVTPRTSARGAGPRKAFGTVLRQRQPRMPESGQFAVRVNAGHGRHSHRGYASERLARIRMLGTGNPRELAEQVPGL